MNFIQRYQPALSWVNELDRFLDRNSLNAGLTSTAREALHESEDGWILRLDLPGFAKADVTLTVTDRTLALKAETPPDRPFGGSTERQWKLGEDIDETAIAATLENGVLELKLPKRPKPEVRDINIQIN
ncbi:MAG: Hsp20/alpha crystallin family protein [Verrucomicrobiota bacterium]